MLLRVEDIDSTRARPEYYSAIGEDLAWLGIRWEGEVRRQSEHFDDYWAALETLAGLGATYPCFCTRNEIAQEAARSAEARHGPDGPLYPGTCRAVPRDEAVRRVAEGEPHAIRLDAGAASRMVGRLTWVERGEGEHEADPMLHGDFVVARKETPTSYHLAVVVDDALQGVTLVTRGRDLREATHAQRLLQALLGLPAPEYRHHGLVLDASGRRLAKRDGAEAVRAMRAAGQTPSEVWAAVDAALEPGPPWRG